MKNCIQPILNLKTRLVARSLEKRASLLEDLAKSLDEHSESIEKRARSLEKRSESLDKLIKSQAAEIERLKRRLNWNSRKGS